ncbi:MAG: DUF4405 domain-containing protein [Candidatus Nezhaarchaeales archaeon]
MPRKKLKVYLVLDLALICLLIVSGVSGFILFYKRFPELFGDAYDGWRSGEVPYKPMRLIHTFSSMAMFVLCIVHVMLHVGWFKSAFRSIRSP